jgi:SAM-dependent methyltransferase
MRELSKVLTKLDRDDDGFFYVDDPPKKLGLNKKSIKSLEKKLERIFFKLDGASLKYPYASNRNLILRDVTSYAEIISLVKSLTNNSNHSVIEIGPSVSGMIALYSLALEGYDCIGADIDERSKYLPSEILEFMNDGKLKFINQRGEILNKFLPRDSIDLIYFSHMEDNPWDLSYDQVVKNMDDILKKGGVFIVDSFGFDHIFPHNSFSKLGYQCYLIPGNNLDRPRGGIWIYQKPF